MVCLPVSPRWIGVDVARVAVAARPAGRACRRPACLVVGRLLFIVSSVWWPNTTTSWLGASAPSRARARASGTAGRRCCRLAPPPSATVSSEMNRTPAPGRRVVGRGALRRPRSRSESTLAEAVARRRWPLVLGLADRAGGRGPAAIGFRAREQLRLELRVADDLDEELVRPSTRVRIEVRCTGTPSRRRWPAARSRLLLAAMLPWIRPSWLPREMQPRHLQALGLERLLRAVEQAGVAREGRERADAVRRRRRPGPRSPS